MSSSIPTVSSEAQVNNHLCQLTLCFDSIDGALYNMPDPSGRLDFSFGKNSGTHTILGGALTRSRTWAFTYLTNTSGRLGAHHLTFSLI